MSEKEKPREGTDLSGPYRVKLAGVQLEHYHSTTLPRDNVDNSRILFECDISATLETGPTEADA